jgi:very-short-patch-repair endonuclease
MVSPNVETPPLPPIEVIRVENGRWIDRTNRVEAEQVIKLIRNHLENRTSNDTIGVITFNSNQRDLIMDLLDAEVKKDEKFATLVAKETARKHNGEDVGLFIKNIENVQGDERDLIIFSFAYAKDANGRMNRNFGWLNQSGGENRLNVAISRSRKKIIIVTSIHPEELVVDDLKNQGPKLFRRYMEYTRAISSNNTKTAEQILNTLTDKSTTPSQPSAEAFEADVLAALKKVISGDYTIESAVGMGSYKIDIAIREVATNRYLLGIELDGHLYENFTQARERDVHRRKYFHARGWKIYRLFSNDWWNNKDEQLDKIIELLDK